MALAGAQAELAARLNDLRTRLKDDLHAAHTEAKACKSQCAAAALDVTIHEQGLRRALSELLALDAHQEQLAVERANTEAQLVELRKKATATSLLVEWQQTRANQLHKEVAGKSQALQAVDWNADSQAAALAVIKRATYAPVAKFVSRKGELPRLLSF